MSITASSQTKLGYLLVGAQFILIFVSLLRFDGFNSIWIFLLCILGLIIGLWALYVMHFKVSVLPKVTPNQPFIMVGPYKFIRHPMYTAILLTFGGTLLSTPSIINAVIWVMLLSVLLAKITIEEKDLRNHFKNYQAYAKKTKRLVPYIY